MRKIRLVVLVLFAVSFLGTASAQEFNIRDSCNSREENLFSIYNQSGGHAAEPGHYDWQVCGSGVEKAELAETCDDDLNSILTLRQRENSHVSIYSNYDISVCTSFDAQINSTCSSSNRIVSLAKLDDSHVGDPNAYDNILCAQSSSVNTVTLKMKVDATDVYVDGQSASPGIYSGSSLDYPYIVSDKPVGIVGYGNTLSINYSDSGSRETFSMTQEGDGSFLIPNTEGGYSSVERREESVTSRSFLQQLSPSFAFRIPENPVVKVIYDPSINITGFEREERGTVNLYVRHRTDNNPEPVIEIGTD